MIYLEVALLKSPLAFLTYQSEIDIKIGTKIQVSLQNRKLLNDAVVIKKVEKPSFKCKNIDIVLPYIYNNFMINISKFISEYYVCSVGESLSLYHPFNDNYKEDKKIETSDKIVSDIKLSPQQNDAYKFCQDNKTALLFANTGSGKTEIYIESIKKHLNENKQAILLMPEISLTPQMQYRLEAVFGQSVALWHSKISKKKKEDILDNLDNGTIKIIAGARSALFLPYKDLGIIIVDEEHDESYKSNTKPRYNAKDISIYLGYKYNIQIILGSATPSISSFFKIPYFRLKTKFFSQSVNEIIFDESPLKLNNIVINKIIQTLEKKEQVIIFLPTRANFKYQVCTDCGKAVECPYCSVSMSLYRNMKALKCHYCNFTHQIPNQCPSCNTGIISNSRLGTAEVWEQLTEIFTNKIVEQFDRDKIKTDKQLRDLLNRFNNNKIDILVGTQMLSKGHDYHNVGLAIILGIDSILNMESYKARENALSLAIQIAGRAGRKNNGEVLIQTKNKDFFEYYLKDSDYEEFLKEELEFRQTLYPPKIRVAKVIFASSNGYKAQLEMLKYKDKISKDTDIQIIKFGEAGIKKISNKYRFELLLRSKSIKKMLEFLHYISLSCPIALIDMDSVS
jgi:primosomal protein N' (replication factor Y) (superfamily II helicase)